MIEFEGVDIDEENEAGQTALHVAIVNDDLEMAEFLLSRGADVSRKTRVFEKDEPRATCECAYTAYCSHVAHEFGNEMRDDGQNALHLAAKYGSGEMLKLLIPRFESVDGTSDDGSTALHYATQNSLEDISAMELLLNSGAGANARNRDGKTPLYLAVKFEKLELVRYLLSRGADVNIPTTKRSTPLYSAIVNCNVELMNLLLANNASIDVENQLNQSPLFYALRFIPKSELRLSLVESLLNHGVSPDSRNNYGSTALHVAVQDRDECLVRLMIARGCPIDAKDCFDMTPLAVAVCTNLQDLAELLLDAGADANLPIKCSSVLEHAVIRRNEPMVELLLRHGADVKDTHRALLAACTHKNTRIVQMLMDRGADVDRKDAQGRTPLMRVILETNYQMMRHLVERGARVNERDRRGNTALYFLIDNDAPNKHLTFAYLLERGADVNVENDQGHTVFAYMISKCFTKTLVVTFVKHVALLLERGRPVNAKIVRQIEARRTWAECLSACRAELARMREARILDRCSYYDVLARGHGALGALFREENAVLEFEIGLTINALVNYCDVLKRCYAKKSRRSKLLKSAVDVLTNEVFRDIFPLEVVECLCEYLSNDDLAKLS